MKKYLYKTKCFLGFNLLLFLAGLLTSNAQVTLNSDFSNSANMKNPMPYHLDVYNRITPISNFAQPDNADGKICIVRPLGGIASNGTADLTKDTYKWNATTKKFETNFTTLKSQIDRIRNAGFGVFQIVLDNPSWDFQRSSTGVLSGNAYKVSTYGNAEPPLDYNAWAKYIRDVMNFLVTTYGRTEVEKIQFGIGREIGTEGHWKGTQEQFFNFYNRTQQSVLTVVPKAKVGAHFLWGSAGTKSWGPAFIKWAKDNNVPYNFVGVSYYPFYNQSARTNFTDVYSKDFGVIKDSPDWNSNAKFEIHEFALIKSLNTNGNAFVSAEAQYQNSFLVGLMKQFYQNDLQNLFQWGTGTAYSPARQHLLAMKNNVYYTNSKSGTQSSSSNYVDAIFARSFSANRYSIMAYNYNASPTANTNENLRLTMILPVKGGTNYRVRSGVYNKTNNTFTYSAWTTAKTPGTNASKSTLSFDRTLPVFAFLKYEVEILTTTKFDTSNAKGEIEDLELQNSSENQNEELLMVYPNPSNDQISIYGLKSQNRNISIIDSNGKVILTTNQTENISVSNLAKGVYFVKVNDSKQIKFVKN